MSEPDRGADGEAADSAVGGPPRTGGHAGDAEREAGPTIRRLGDRTIERIAAGEVVTRPADVVTELVENALDAGASTVEVTVEGDGTDRIRVADDGHGMPGADAPLAVAHHATSKLPGDAGADGPDDRDASRAAAGDGSTDGLDRVRTLGFRGEALASVAAVARLELTTNDGGPRATRVVVDRDATGEEPRTEPAGRGRGTTVEVRDLFHNRPARRKSLASTRAEFARVSEAVTRYALVRPDVRFRLVHDDNETLATPGSGSFVDAALAVYDRETASRSTTFDHEAVLPVGGADGRDPCIDDSSDEGDDGDDPCDEGDDGTAAPTVAVDGLLCFPDVTRASRDGLHVSVNGRALADSTVRSAVVDGYGSLLPGGRYPVAVVRVALPPAFVDANVHPAKREVRYRDADAVARAVEAGVRDALSTADLRRSGELAMDLDASLQPLEEAGAGEDGEPASAFGDVTVVGQFRGLYLLCAADDDLLVIDQHAAHERVNFERLRAAVDDAITSRDLDPPETVRLDPREASLAEAHAGTLERLGFGLEPFGGRTYRVVAVPAPLGRPADVDALRETLAALDGPDGRDGESGEAARDPGAVREDLLRDLACHPSLKAGDDLDDEAATALVDRLGQCEQPYTCPHGRPTVLSIEERTLAKGFGRSATRFD